MRLNKCYITSTRDKSLIVLLMYGIHFLILSHCQLVHVSNTDLNHLISVYNVFIVFLYLISVYNVIIVFSSYVSSLC